MLKRFAFLAGYKLVQVSNIEVKKRKFDPAARFTHKLQILNSIDSEFTELAEITDQHTDNHSIILMKSIKETNDFLNLSPFIVDTDGSRVNTEDMGLPKRDIFLFDKYDGRKIYYYGSESKATDDLSYLEQYDDLIAEYNEMINVFSNEK